MEEVGSVTEFVMKNWEWFLLGFMVVEKAVKKSKWQWDDILFDMVLDPIFKKIKPKGK